MALIVTMLSCIPSSAKEPELDSGYSNIRVEDYVGPEVCGSCHSENFTNWQQHPHSRMNQLATVASVLGDFSGVGVEYGGRRAVFLRQGEDFFVEHYTGDILIRRIRITRVIGWRYEQDYVGIQVMGPEPATDPLYTEQNRVRFSWSLDRQRWLPQSYMEPTEYPGSEYLDDGSLRHDPFTPERVAFNDRCARCHNTYPYDMRLYRIFSDDGMVSGFPPHGLRRRVIRDLAQQRGDTLRLATQRLPVDRFVTIGISCESCHFGGREHAEDGSEPIRFVPSHPSLSDWTPDHRDARKNPVVINSICRQCHHSGVGASDNWPDGSASVNSMEAVEQDRGACGGEIRCTLCHSAHISGPQAGAPDRAEHLATCVECHQELATLAGARSHSHHDADQASCLDCHMPRIVQGFTGYNRSHRISSPSEPEILATGMPNACNLCHLDRSLAWTRDTIASRWGTRVTLSPSLMPEFGANFELAAGPVWLQYPFAMTRTVAAGAYARSPLGRTALPALTRHLEEPNAYVRLRFLLAVERILGRRLSDEEYTLMGGDERRQTQLRLLRGRLPNL
jgi:hypothetical protein